MLDLLASISPHAMLKRLGASWAERRFGGSLEMQATYNQTPQLLTVVRELTDEGKILISSSTLKIAGESGSWTLRRIWRKDGSK